MIRHRPDELQATDAGMVVFASVLGFIVRRKFQKTDARQIGVVNVYGVEVACVLAYHPGSVGHRRLFQVNVVLDRLGDVFAGELVDEQFDAGGATKGQGHFILDVARQVVAPVVFRSFLFTFQDVVGYVVDKINGNLGNRGFQHARSEWRVDVVGYGLIHFIKLWVLSANITRVFFRKDGSSFCSAHILLNVSRVFIFSILLVRVLSSWTIMSQRVFRAFNIFSSSKRAS